MTIRSVIPSFLVAVGLLASGCGSSKSSTTSFTCADFCAERNACSTTTTPIDCPTACADVGTLNTAGSCTSSFDTLMTCLGNNQSAICTLGPTSTTCQVEGLSYLTCESAYCAAHQTDPTCQILSRLVLGG